MYRNVYILKEWICLFCPFLLEFLFFLLFPLFLLLFLLLFFLLIFFQGLESLFLLKLRILGPYILLKILLWKVFLSILLVITKLWKINGILHESKL